MFKCKICGDENPKYINRCEEHYRCDDCGTKDSLCTYSEGVLCSPCHAVRAAKRIENFTGDTSYKSEVACPWCGHVHGDSWELGSDEDEMECSDCENTFVYTRDIDVTYSTEKINSK